MNRTEAHELLNRAREGANVPADDVTRALQATGDLTRGCACPSPDAHQCARMRYGYDPETEPCECPCHGEQEGA